MAVPDNFRIAAREFADSLRAIYASPQSAQPEDQLKAPVMALLRSVRQQVLTKTEVQVDELGGRPDIGVEVNGALCGHIELKAPGLGAETRKFKGRDKAQWLKFTALPNLIYTDACEWALYRSGVPQPKDGPVVVRLDRVIEKGAAALTEPTLAALYGLLTDFLDWGFVAPSGPKALAETLAPICRMLRDDVALAVARENSALRRLSAEMRDYLFPHSSDEDFADIYAQTLTYALLLARLNGETPLTTAGAADRLDSGHGLLAETLRVLTQSRARAEIQLPVTLLERVIGAVDPVRLGSRGDPWLYFYEDFLSAYDPKRRREYGVYYTPQPVVACQINLVAQLLDQAFNKPMSFADDGVVLLDSSAGTSAYPLAAIEFALRKVEAQLGPGAVAEYATRCAQNVYAFEVQVGPYAVSHLRLTKLLSDAGATLPADGLHVFLTDTLESPHVDPPQPPLMAERLTEEQRRARRVKADVPVFVSVGNPPYFREQADDGSANTRGKWVRFGDSTSTSAAARRASAGGRPILDDFIAFAPAVHVKNLYNLYVYFWRWTLWKMFEQPGAPRRGIVSFITASSYLRGPGFAGMRKHMREAFDALWIIDLEGDSLGTRKTENVFAIQTPVCIAFGVRYAEAKRHALAQVRYTRFEGSRDEKLARLAATTSFASVDWQDCFEQAAEPFLPQQAGDYFSWPQITDIWPWQHSGVELKRTWPIGETQAVLAQRWQALLALPKAQRPLAFRESPDRLVAAQYKGLNSDIKQTPIADLPADAPHAPIVRYGFRSLDRAWLMLDNRLAARLRPPLWAVQGGQQVFMTSLLTGVLGTGPAATVTAHVPDRHYFSGRGGKDVIPLWRDAAGTLPNLPRGLLARLSDILAIQVSASDLLAYNYGVLSAPGYVAAYAAELTLPPLRLPITADTALFAALVAQGRRLIWLHTYGERFVPAGQVPGRIPPGVARSLKGIATTAIGYPDKFDWLADPSNPDTGVLQVGDGQIGPVPRAVWAFSVSGHEPLKAWLAFRMKNRSGRKSSALDDIRPGQWDAALSQELRELIWVLEATVDAQPELDRLLRRITAGPVVGQSQLPQPTDAERAPPGDDGESSPQASLL